MWDIKIVQTHVSGLGQLLYYLQWDGLRTGIFPVNISRAGLDSMSHGSLAVRWPLLFYMANYRKYEYNPLEVRFDLKADSGRLSDKFLASWVLFVFVFLMLLLFLISPNTDAINDLGEANESRVD